MKTFLFCLGLLALVSCKKSSDDPGAAPEKTVNDVVLDMKSLNVPISSFDIGNYGFQSIMVGNNIYFANYSNTAKAQFFVRYSISSNTFSSALAKSSNVCACGYMSRLVTDGTNIYYIANDATKYVASSNTWQTLTYPSTAKDNAGEAGAAYYNGNVYFVGGRTPTTYFKYYSVGQDKWFTAPNYLYPTSRSELAVYKDKLFVFGGEGAKRKVAVFSTSGGQWTPLKDAAFDINTSYERTYSAVLGNYIFLLQGNSMYVYDPEKDVWSTTPIALNDVPAYGNLFSDGQKLYIAGKNSSNIPVVYALTVSTK